MRKKIVLFDLDGTLVKTGGSGAKALNKAIEYMGGINNVCDFFNLQGCTDKDNLTTAFYTAFKRKPNKTEYEKLKKLYLKFLPGEVENSVKNKKYEKIKGIEKFLKSLKEINDVMIGFATGNLKEGAFIKLKPSDLLPYFEFGGFGDLHSQRHNMLLEAVRQAELKLKSKIEPGDVYVIGDTEKDISAAKICGYHNAIVLDGFGDIKEIRRNWPELLEDNYLDIDIWLMWLGLKKDPKGVKRGAYICPDTPIEHAHYGKTGMGDFLSNKDFKSIEEIIKKAKNKK
jgi:phosphoglycolate phosphatase-like HAD superfamily hydrolase